MLTTLEIVERGLLPSRDPETCWEWQRSKDWNGYGLTHRGIAHRLAYEAFVGPIPDGMLVLHTCDNPPCCNPAHLFLGTHFDNAADRDSKGRDRPHGKGGPLLQWRTDMHRTSIVFPSDVWERLIALSMERDEPMVRTVTRAIRRELDEADIMRVRGSGCHCTGPWWGVLPAPCPIHNPSPPTITTNHT
jgi:hypothetical protein